MHLGLYAATTAAIASVALYVLHEADDTQHIHSALRRDEAHIAALDSKYDALAHELRAHALRESEAQERRIYAMASDVAPAIEDACNRSLAHNDAVMKARYDRDLKRMEAQC